jgi:hypothetical protein
MPWSPYPLESINEEEAELLSKGAIRSCDTCGGEGWQESRQGGRWLCPRCRGARYMRWRGE